MNWSLWSLAALCLLTLVNVTFSAGSAIYSCCCALSLLQEHPRSSISYQARIGLELRLLSKAQSTTTLSLRDLSGIEEHHDNKMAFRWVPYQHKQNDWFFNDSWVDAAHVQTQNPYYYPGCSLGQHMNNNTWAYGGGTERWPYVDASILQQHNLGGVRGPLDFGDTNNVYGMDVHGCHDDWFSTLR